MSDEKLRSLCASVFLCFNFLPMNAYLFLSAGSAQPGSVTAPSTRSVASDLFST